jgi:hypothetical protein
LLAAPDMGSWWRTVMGRRWPSFKYPEHVVYYDRSSLTQLLATLPFEKTQAIPYPHAFPVNLVLRKLRIPKVGLLENKAIWLPATTVAVVGRKPSSAKGRRAA